MIWSRDKIWLRVNFLMFNQLVIFKVFHMKMISSSQNAVTLTIWAYGQRLLPLRYWLWSYVAYSEKLLARNIVTLGSAQIVPIRWNIFLIIFYSFSFITVYQRWNPFVFISHGYCGENELRSFQLFILFYCFNTL